LENFSLLATSTVADIDTTTIAIKGLYDYMKRRADVQVNKLAIEKYFSDQRLEEFTQALADKKLVYCNQLSCENEEEFYDEIAPIVLNVKTITEEDKSNPKIKKIVKNMFKTRLEQRRR